jgi:hypothetical protein
MGGKSTTSTQTIKIPPEVMARYKAVNERAEKVASEPFQKYEGQFVAGLTDQQKAGMAGVTAAANMAQPYLSTAADMTKAGSQAVGPLTAEQIKQYENPYTQSVVDTTMKAMRQQQGQDLAQQQALAIKSGGFGGDRAGIARAVSMGQQDLARAQAESGLRSKGYELGLQTAVGQQGVQAANLQRLLGAGQQYGALGTAAQQAALQGAQAQIGAGTLEQQTQQADLTAKYQQFLQERGFPYQQAQFLANIAMGTGALSGSTTTTTQPGGFFSDERLKDNIEPIGQTYDGQPIYRYDYGDGKTQIGLMAQDVLESGRPGVGLHPSGYLTVNYRDATDDAAAMASMGGAVTEPGEYARGGYVAGGLVANDDLRAILQSQAQAFGPFSTEGLYGGKGAGAAPPGATGIIPPANLPVPRMLTAGALPQQQSSGASQAMSIGKGIADLYSAGKSLKSEFMPSDLEKAAKLKREDELKTYLEKVRKPSAHGGLIPHYADGGAADTDDVMPYGQDAMGGNQDILGDVVKAGTMNPQSLPKPGDLPRQRSGLEDVKDIVSIGSSIASIASMLPFSDERLKHNIEPVGETFDGQNIYRYDMGDGRTKIGLMAQEVLQRRPDAVGERDGYLTLDYDRATEDAASPFAYGGVVPRQGYADGDKVEEPPVPPADIPEDFETRLNKTMSALSRIESGDRYDITGPTSRKGDKPYGKYQVMGANIPSWTEEALGRRLTPEEFLADKDAQDATARHRAGLYLKQYDDPRQVASMWLSGRPIEKAGSDKDVLGTDVPKYLSMFDKYYGGAESRPRGLVVDADKPAPKAKEAQFRSEEPSFLSSLGEKATSERYMVPALSFLGSMLASRSPFLGQAIGEGLVGGVAGYQSMQKQQMEMAKNIVDMVGNRFERVLVGSPPQLTYRNKLTGDTYRPEQMSGMVYGALKSAGIPPEMYGVAKPILGGAAVPSGAAAPAGAGAQPEKGAEGVAAAPVAGAAPAAGEPAKAPATQKAIEDMSKGELKLYFEKNPAAAGFEPNDPNNPQILRRNIIANQQREQAAIEAGLTDEAAKAQAQVKEDQARLRDVLNDAAEMQAKINEKRGELTTVRADKYISEIAPRLARVKFLQGEMARLGDIYSEFTPGRAEAFKTAMIDWANGLGVGNFSDTLQKKLANVSKYDEATKITMDEVYKNVVSEGLVRAPAASAAGLSKTTPSPDIGAGAVYALIGRMVGESEYVRKRDEAYLDARPGTDPTRFINDYEKKDPYGLKKEVARGLSMVPLPKDPAIRAQVDSLYKTYGPYGYKPMGTEEAGAVTQGSAIPEPLRGTEGLLYSPSRNQYRDAQGNIYDATGKRVQ